MLTEPTARADEEHSTRVRDIAADLARHWGTQRHRRGRAVPFIGGTEESESEAHLVIAEALLAHVLDGVRWSRLEDGKVVYYALKPEGSHCIVEFDLPDEFLVVRSLNDLSKVADRTLRHIDTEDVWMVAAVNFAAEYVRKRRRR